MINFFGMAEFSGEEKLRIVLESILRNVPKNDQCQKYGITEAEFDSWHDKLIKDGGKIFEASNSRSKRTSRSRSSKSNKNLRFILTLSLFLNLSAVVLIFWWFFNSDSNSSVKAEDLISSKVGNSDSKDHNDANMISPEIKADPDFDQKIQEKVLVKNNSVDSAKVEFSPIEALNKKIIPEVSDIALAREVSLLGKQYEGKHVVYLIDVGLDDRLQEVDFSNYVPLIHSVKESISSLSSNSYFNLILYWNLREASALGKTILRASEDNKKYAVEWLDSLGSDSLSFKENRSNFYPQELLYAKPMPGVVGPWYGLSLAASFDPDLVFAFSGSLPSYKKNQVPKSHFSALGIDPFSDYKSGLNVDKDKVNRKVEDHIKKTAVAWLKAINFEEANNLNPNELQEVALRKLGLAGDYKSVFGVVEIPWKKSFENFLMHLETNFSDLPQVHYFLSLPQDTSWPTELSNSILEFVDSSKGTFTSGPAIP